MSTARELHCYLCGGDDFHLRFQGRDELMGFPGRFQMLQCGYCGLVFLHPRPEPEDLERFYPENYPPFRPGYSAPSRAERIRRRREIRSLRKSFGYPGGSVMGLRFPGWIGRKRVLPVRWVPRGVILDVGCATGDRLALWHNLGWEVWGVEPNPYAAQVAATTFAERIRATMLEDAGFQEHQFDAVTMEHVLEHVPSPRKTISEVHRVLKPGGQLVVRVPNGAGWETAVFRGKSAAADIPRHLWVFDSQTLTRLLEEYGFGIESMVTFSNLYTLTHGLDAVLKLTPLYPLPELNQPRWVAVLRRVVHLGCRGLIPLQRIADRMGRGSELTVSAFKK